MSQRAFSDYIIQDRDLSQNIHFFEENRQKQGRFVPQCQNLSVGVKICQSTHIEYEKGISPGLIPPSSFLVTVVSVSAQGGGLQERAS
jgi:hypothetical protein